MGGYKYDMHACVRVLCSLGKTLDEAQVKTPVKVLDKVLDKEQNGMEKMDL